MPDLPIILTDYEQDEETQEKITITYQLASVGISYTELKASLLPNQKLHSSLGVNLIATTTRQVIHS